jgi:uncharacterized protein
MTDTTTYVGTVGSISADDVEALSEGANFYSPSASVANRGAMASWLSSLLRSHGPVPLVPAQALDPATLCVSVCVLGSALALADVPPAGHEFESAVQQVATATGAEVGAVYPLSAATISAVAAVITAAQLGVPLIDADGMGRTYALIHQTSMYLAGISPTPAVALGPTGESVLIDVQEGPRADRLLRASVDVVGGWAALAAYPTTAGRLRSAALPGTMSRLINVGRLLLEGHDPDLLLQRLSAINGCRRIGRGRIVELEHLSRPTDVAIPAHPSSLVVDETGGLGRQLRIELRSEIVAVFADGELVAAAPDLLCLLDVSSGRLATLDSLQPGDLVDVLETPADAVWHSPEGLAMAGAASHGIPLAHPRRR